MHTVSQTGLVLFLSFLVAVLGGCGGGSSVTTPPPPPPVVSMPSLFFNPPTVVGGPGVTAAGTVILNSAATAATSVALMSSDPAVSVPATVVVPSGMRSATFTANANAVGSATVATITAALGAGNVMNTLRVNPPQTVLLSEQIILAGGTGSPDFPVTSGAFQTTFGSLDTSWAGSVTLTTPVAGATAASEKFMTYIGQTGTVSGVSFGQARDTFIDASGNV